MPKHEDYKARFLKLTPGDKVYDAHATYRYEEEGGGRAGICTSSYTVKNVVHEVIRIETTRTVNGVTDTSETVKHKYYLECEDGVDFDIDDFNGKEGDCFLNKEDLDIALAHWDEYHNGDTHTQNFYKIRTKYLNIDANKKKYNEIQNKIKALEKELRDLENE